MQLYEVIFLFAIVSYFSAFGIFFTLLLKPIRLAFYAAENKFYRKKLHLFFILRQFLIFIFPLMFFITFLCCVCPRTEFFTILSDNFLSLIVLGLAINVFLIVQLPLLNKSNVVIDFSVDNVNDFKEDIELKSNTEQIIYCRIYNSGYSILKNSVILIYFKQGIEIIPYSKVNYEQLDFQKKFSTQECHSGALFAPLENFQTIPPQEWFVFPLKVKPLYRIISFATVLVNSDTSWGQSEYIRKMKIR